MKKNTPAFTLVETLVAISILLVAIVGPFYAIQRSITASYIARDQLIGSSLSQEAVEYVYALRDGNYLTNQKNGTSIPWLAGADGTTDASGNSTNCTTANGCTLDPTQSVPLVACAAGGCMPLTLDTSTGRYTQVTTNPVTKFTRKVVVTTISSVEAKVQVTVTWKTLTTPYTLVTTEELYNWL